MKNFKNKVVVITGAGSGIGRALALAFEQEGARLALNDYDVNTLAETVELLTNKDVLQAAFDVSNKAEMFAFATSVIEKYGQADVMINNAGLALGDYAFDEMDLDMFERVMDVNFNGVLYGSRAFIPHLLKQPAAALVNVSSIFGLAGIALNTPYCASKFAVHGFNQCLIQEYKGTALQVHSVHPGGIDTNITKNAIDYKEIHDRFHKAFLKRSPAAAAQVIIKGIRKKRSRILIGGEARQLDFMLRFFPVWGLSLVNKIIQRKVQAVLNKK